MKQHKWANEIKAWADGAEIEVKNSMDINEWIPCAHPNWSEGFTEEVDWIEYRIKPQPKEPQDLSSKSYLYVYKNKKGIDLTEMYHGYTMDVYIGKIPLIVENNDAN